jgi:hypothetical protein
MKQYVYEPYDKSWKATYTVNQIGSTMDNLMIHEIKSETALGVVSMGLCSQGQAIGLYDEYIPYTATQLIAKSVAANCTLYVFEDKVSTVTKNTAENIATDYLTYSIPVEVSASVISTANHTIDVLVPYGTNVAALVGTFTLSTGATVKKGATAQVSGATANNFTAPVVFTVTSEHGETQNWTVTVTDEPNIEHDFTAFSLAEQTGAATIGAGTISVEVPYGTVLTALVPTFTLSFGATAQVGLTEQESGVTPNNFTAPVSYTVFAEDGSTSGTWIVTVTVAANTATDVLTYSFAEQTGAATVNPTNHTVAIEVANGTVVTGLVATFTLSHGATANVGVTPQVTAVTANDFTNPVVYAVKAEDTTTTQNWTVTVTVAP